MIKLPQALISLLSFSCDQMVWIRVSISNCFSLLMTPKYSTLGLHFHWLLWFHILYLVWHHLGSTSTSQICIWKRSCTGLLEVQINPCCSLLSTSKIIRMQKCQHKIQFLVQDWFALARECHTFLKIPQQIVTYCRVLVKWGKKYI